MNDRGMVWFVCVVVLIAGIHCTGNAATSGDEASSSADDGRYRSFLARRPEVRLRERPEANSPTVGLSLAGCRLRARPAPGEWLKVDAHWLPAADVVEMDSAIDYFSAEIAQAESEFSYLGRARAWLAKKEYAKAQADVSAALRLAPRCARAYLVRGAIANELQQDDEALRDFDRAIELDAHDAFALNVRGWYLLKHGDYDKAIADFDQAIASFPSSLSLRGRGWSWYRKQGFEKAVADFDHALRLDPMDAYALAGRAAVRANRKEYDAAIADANDAIRLDAKTQVAYVVRGVIRTHRGELEAAVSDLDEAVRLHASDVYAYRYRAQARHKQKRFDDALADFTQAISLDPIDADTYLFRAAVWHEKDDQANVILDLTEFLRRRPDRGDVYAQRGWSRLATHSAAALDDFNVALRLDPRSIAALLGRARYWLSTRAFAKTVDDCDAVLDIDPRNTSALLTRGEAWLEQRRFDKAIADYTQLAVLDPELAEMAQKMVGLLKQQRKQDDDAQTAPPEEPLWESKDWRASSEISKTLKRFGELAEGKKGSEAKKGTGTIVEIITDPANLHQQGHAAIGARKFAEAASVLSRASSLADDALRPTIEHDLAWLLAVCPDDAVRDGKRAVELARSG